MPARHRFTREEITDTAFMIVRDSGMDALTARSLASELSASPKVIFGHFTGMDELRDEVMSKAGGLYASLMTKALNRKDILPYRSCGMCFVRFAHDEKELFRLLFMNDGRQGLSFDDPTLGPICSVISEALGVSLEDAKEMHARYSVFAYGLACMAVISPEPLDEDKTDMLLCENWEDLVKRYRRGK